MSENKSLVSKSEISSYLHAATEMERDIYTLETIYKELEETEKEAEGKAEHMLLREGLNDYLSLKNKCVENISHARENCELKPANFDTDFKPSDFSVEPFFKKVFSGLCIGFAVLGIDILAIGILNNISGVVIAGICVIVAGWLPALIIANNAKIKKAADKNRLAEITNAVNTVENEKILREYLEEQNKTLEECQKEIDKRLSEINKLKIKAQNCRDQITPIKKVLQPLYSNRDKFYSVGIVPPDYRTMDCVYVLDQIFRNDLADTMRDAVLLYEERTFRGDVIRGMKNITAHIDNLSSLMSSLRVDINMIGRDVALLRDDMDKIYTQNLNAADAAARHNDRMYEETKLHRYAVEALQKSNQKIVDYIES